MNLKKFLAFVVVAFLIGIGFYFFPSRQRAENPISPQTPVSDESNITETVLEKKPTVPVANQMALPSPKEKRGEPVGVLESKLLVPAEIQNVLSDPEGKYDEFPASNEPQVVPPTGLGQPPLKLKNIGVNFEDFKFTKEKIQFDRLFMGFGFIIPGAQSSGGIDKTNPQPTYILPLGTPVRAIVDGVVAAMPVLWSGDISVQITANGKMETWVYEMEHIKNPTIKVGDKVIAGQIIGQVSDFYNGAPSGYGAVEIGILKGGNPPKHVCPYAYFDDSVREDMFAKIRNIFQSWEDYVGDQTLYSDTEIPGCLILTPVDG